MVVVLSQVVVALKSEVIIAIACGCAGGYCSWSVVGWWLMMLSARRFCKCMLFLLPLSVAVAVAFVLLSKHL